MYDCICVYSYHSIFYFVWLITHNKIIIHTITRTKKWIILSRPDFSGAAEIRTLSDWSICAFCHLYVYTSMCIKSSNSCNYTYVYIYIYIYIYMYVTPLSLIAKLRCWYCKNCPTSLEMRLEHGGKDTNLKTVRQTKSGFFLFWKRFEPLLTFLIQRRKLLSIQSILKVSIQSILKVSIQSILKVSWFDRYGHVER